MRRLILMAVAALTLPVLAAERIPVANEGSIGDRWNPVPGTLYAPPYPEEYAGTPEDVCLVIGYLVNADGHTSDFSLLKSWSSGSNSRGRTEFWETFASTASRVMGLWQYEPKSGVTPGPVYTAATFVFGHPENSAATQAHCVIADLTQRLVELRYDGRAGRLMARGIYSRLAIDPAVEERLRQQTVMAREAAIRNGRAERDHKPQERTQSPPSGNK